MSNWCHDSSLPWTRRRFWHWFTRPSEDFCSLRFPGAKDEEQVRAFLDLAGYYRTSIPSFSSAAAPLTALTQKSAPTQVVWSPVCQTAFNTLRHLLSSAPILSDPDFDRHFILRTKGSDLTAGAVLAQLDAELTEHPVAYFSRKFLPGEFRYASVEKECLAIKLTVW